MKPTTICFLALGSNLGKRDEYIRSAIRSINETEGIQILKESEIIETKPLEVETQPYFLNCLLKISTDLSPIELLDSMQEIEARVGRKKTFSKGPREIDIDILIYGIQKMKSERLELPHHSLHSRDYIRLLLVSLNEFDVIRYFSEVARVNDYTNLS
ncbi:MAG: 2-amino-4-hydroxy-6-hydroxymethyldihydropteridine diphosphokinase [Leptospiraceae bacterium]|nr:2-amino-4-hydroxy-6-hydroxymethyldihydropteridine diphosphokinase [Leptospiraceae bacterium]MCP5513138.1 2-amino-4-hydroxy-6-hydroxymethyldihydropteridine diphosphokinase [Leptospiraceae bacterium]